jgi:hypothetical protein
MAGYERVVYYKAPSYSIRVVCSRTQASDTYESHTTLVYDYTRPVYYTNESSTTRLESGYEAAPKRPRPDQGRTGDRREAWSRRRDDGDDTCQGGRGT